VRSRTGLTVIPAIPDNIDGDPDVAGDEALIGERHERVESLEDGAGDCEEERDVGEPWLEWLLPPPPSAANKWVERWKNRFEWGCIGGDALRSHTAHERDVAARE